MDLAFIAVLTVWTLLSLLRFIDMYDPSSAAQQWRRWDWFRLIPVGAFFSPRVPETEHWLVIRDLLEDGRLTDWTEVPRIRPRTWWHALWNPQKQIYRGRVEAARGLLSDAAELREESDRLPAEFLLIAPYLTILRYIVALPRIAEPRATQFAVIETDVLTRRVVRTVLSAMHEV